MVGVWVCDWTAIRLGEALASLTAIEPSIIKIGPICNENECSATHLLKLPIVCETKFNFVCSGPDGYHHCFSNSPVVGGRDNSKPCDSCDLFRVPKSSASKHDFVLPASDRVNVHNHDACVPGSDTNTPRVTESSPVAMRSGCMVENKRHPSL